MENINAKDLLKKYIEGNCTDKEKALLESWYIHRSAHGKVDLSAEEIDNILTDIWNALPVHDKQKKLVYRLLPTLAAAASLLVMLIVSSYFFLYHKPDNHLIVKNKEILPGSNKAVLTLANGEQVILTDAKNGQIGRQGNTIVNKTSEGSLVYRPGDQDATPADLYNTVSTPRGGQYHLILADGTDVWINASSSITYPAAFNGSERKVTLTGEAFFVVKHNSSQPFKVTVQGQTIEDLGTQFNIKAYKDEPKTKTTLLQGSVKITKGGQAAILKPGQEAITEIETEKIAVNEADMEEAIAWKNGYFMFSGESLENIMRSISRWYNVDVVFQSDDLKKITFSGTISKLSDFSRVLDRLKRTNEVDFNIQAGKIIVLPAQQPK